MKQNAVKIYIFCLIIFTIVYQFYMGSVMEYPLSFIHTVGSFGVLYAIYHSFSIQKNATKIWIWLTLIVPQLLFLLAILHRIITGYGGNWKTDVDRWTTIFIMLVPIIIGGVSLILVSKYLSENKEQITI